MSSLNAFYEDQLVGTLNRDEELVYSFTYAEAWLQNPQRFPLSLAMPLDKKQFGNKITLSFFENLLPEGDVMKSLQQAHGISGMFDFLQTFGRDCAGAIIVTEQSAHVHSVDPSQKVLIDMNKVYSAIDEHRSVADIVAGMNPADICHWLVPKTNFQLSF